MMKAYLKEMQKEPPGTALVVRRIQKLGVNAPTTLKEHFSKYGTVRRVVCVPREKVQKDKDGNKIPPSAPDVDPLVLAKPSTVAFLAMGTPEETENALADGKDTQIDGIDVLIHAFMSSDADKGDDCSDDDKQARRVKPKAKAKARPNTFRESNEYENMKRPSPELPVCQFCMSSIATSVNVSACQVCHRGSANIPDQRFSKVPRIG